MANSSLTNNFSPLSLTLFLIGLNDGQLLCKKRDQVIGDTFVIDLQKNKLTITIVNYIRLISCTKCYNIFWQTEKSFAKVLGK